MSEISEFIKGGIYLVSILSGLILLYVLTAIVVNYVEKH
jgi:hypothetical protein